MIVVVEVKISLFDGLVEVPFPDLVDQVDKTTVPHLPVALVPPYKVISGVYVVLFLLFLQL